MTRGHEKEDSISFRIVKVESPVPNLGQYLPADGRFQEISQLAGKIERMSQEEQVIFSGILDRCSVSAIEEVLQAADSLQLYDYAGRYPLKPNRRLIRADAPEGGIKEWKGRQEKRSSTRQRTVKRPSMACP
ncbi:MAG: hypothetical protein K2O91_22985 [Lachnospiraceae bacterium]|nr:hypothetical protein [Lachnospiraceae bacterium]